MMVFRDKVIKELHSSCTRFIKNISLINILLKVVAMSAKKPTSIDRTGRWLVYWSESNQRSYYLDSQTQATTYDAPPGPYVLRVRRV